MKSIELFIADDSRIHVEGLKLILRAYNHIHVGGQAYTVTEMLHSLEGYSPDILLLDISLEKDTDGIEAIPLLRKKHPEMKIIILTHYKDVKYLVRSLRAGASAYLPKDIRPEELLHAIHAVKEGNGVYLGDTLPLAILLEAFGSEKNRARNKSHDLTEREIEIINQLAKGLSTKEIAGRLQIEVNTVESHKERIKDKLKVNTVIQIVVQSLKKGIILLE